MRSIVTRIAGGLVSLAGALGIWWAQESKIVAPHYILIASIIILALGVILFIASFFLPKKSDNKSQDKILLNQAYPKVLGLLPKMKARLTEIPYKVSKKQISQSTLHSINLNMLKIGVGEKISIEERIKYFTYLTGYMDNSNIKLTDYINGDTDWKELDMKLDKHKMLIQDKELKKSIWKYRLFIIGTYYERVYDEYNSLLFNTHRGKHNRDAINELRLNEISTHISQRIAELRSKNN